jgi:hypothetical protein
MLGYELSTIFFALWAFTVSIIVIIAIVKPELIRNANYTWSTLHKAPMLMLMMGNIIIWFLMLVTKGMGI